MEKWRRYCSHSQFGALPVEVYGVGEGVAEGSTDGLGVGVPNGGVGVGETSDPGVGLASAE
jgi:hypothetical protein